MPLWKNACASIPDHPVNCTDRGSRWAPSMGAVCRGWQSWACPSGGKAEDQDERELPGSTQGAVNRRLPKANLWLLAPEMLTTAT